MEGVSQLKAIKKYRKAPAEAHPCSGILPDPETPALGVK
jgi:hypothetical protein